MKNSFGNYAQLFKLRGAESIEHSGRRHEGGGRNGDPREHLTLDRQKAQDQVDPNSRQVSQLGIGITWFFQKQGRITLCNRCDVNYQCYSLYIHKY